MLLLGGLASAGEPSSDLRARFDEIRARGAWSELLRAADGALLGAKDDVVAWEFRAYALHKLGRLTEASEAYGRITEIAPTNAWAWTQHGNLAIELGRTDDAAASLLRALRIDPSSADAWKKLVRARRADAAWDDALRDVASAAKAGVEPAWCASERATLLWTKGDAAAAKAAWAEARRAGADPEVCDVGDRLVAWDLGLSAPERMRAVGGAPWTFRAGGVVVESRVGPWLPPEVDEALHAAARDCADFLGTPRPDGEVTLVLSRTLDEHETLRRRLFPATQPGRAFTTQAGVLRDGGREGGRDAGRDRDRNDVRPGARIHVHFGRADLARTLRHEMSHALLYSRPRNRSVPSWLDEGAATHLEDPGARPDLVSTIEDAVRRRALPTAIALVNSTGAEFAGPDGRLRYALSWALVRHLVALRGADRFRTLAGELGRDFRAGAAAELAGALGIATDGLQGVLDRAVAAAVGTSVGAGAGGSGGESGGGNPGPDDRNR